MNQQIEIFNTKPSFHKYNYNQIDQQQGILISDTFWLSSLFGDSLLLPAINATDDRQIEIKNNL